MTLSPTRPKNTSHPVHLVIFDWAGTTVDHGSLAPVHAFDATFRAHGVELSHADIRGPMGLHKKDHIRSLFGLETTATQWKQAHGREWTEDDVEVLYQAFMPLQIEQAQQLSDLIPGVRECFEELTRRGIHVGSSTGYPRVVAAPTIAAAAQQGYHPAATVCADDVPAGRPAPWMIFRNMEELGVYPAAAVLKVGDTIPDIQAGINAGVRTIGITATGSEVGLGEEEWGQLTSDEQQQATDRAAEVLQEAGADAILSSIAQLPDWIDQYGL